MNILQKLVENKPYNGKFYIMGHDCERVCKLPDNPCCTGSLQMALINAALMCMRKVAKPVLSWDIQIGPYKIVFEEWHNECTMDGSLTVTVTGIDGAYMIIDEEMAKEILALL